MLAHFRDPQVRVVCQGKSKQRRRVTGSYDSRSRHVLLEPAGDRLTPSEFAYKARTAVLRGHACVEVQEMLPQVVSSGCLSWGKCLLTS